MGAAGADAHPDATTQMAAATEPAASHADADIAAARTLRGTLEQHTVGTQLRRRVTDVLAASIKTHLEKALEPATKGAQVLNPLPNES